MACALEGPAFGICTLIRCLGKQIRSFKHFSELEMFVMFFVLLRLLLASCKSSFVAFVSFLESSLAVIFESFSFFSSDSICILIFSLRELAVVSNSFFSVSSQ